MCQAFSRQECPAVGPGDMVPCLPGVRMTGEHLTVGIPPLCRLHCPKPTRRPAFPDWQGPRGHRPTRKDRAGQGRDELVKGWSPRSEQPQGGWAENGALGPRLPPRALQQLSAQTTSTEASSVQACTACSLQAPSAAGLGESSGVLRASHVGQVPASSSLGHSKVQVCAHPALGGFLWLAPLRTSPQWSWQPPPWRAARF